MAEEVCGQLLRKAHEQVCVIVAAQERLLLLRLALIVPYLLLIER